MANKMTDRELKLMGIRGEVGTDYVKRGDTVEIKVTGAVFADSGLSVTTLYPGDLVYIFSNASFSPQDTAVAVEAHPALLQHGFCSFSRVVMGDSAGRVTILFRCERELTVSELPYLVKAFSLGPLRD